MDVEDIRRNSPSLNPPSGTSLNHPVIIKQELPEISGSHPGMPPQELGPVSFTKSLNPINSVINTTSSDCWGLLFNDF